MFHVANVNGRAEGSSMLFSTRVVYLSGLQFSSRPPRATTSPGAQELFQVLVRRDSWLVVRLVGGARCGRKWVKMTSPPLARLRLMSWSLYEGGLGRREDASICVGSVGLSVRRDKEVGDCQYRKHEHDLDKHVLLCVAA
jgi:hypothetical protein